MGVKWLAIKTNFWGDLGLYFGVLGLVLGGLFWPEFGVFGQSRNAVGRRKSASNRRGRFCALYTPLYLSLLVHFLGLTCAQPLHIWQHSRFPLER